MIILNPIYDVAFKYLMEDTEIAREMLSVIINENIISLKALAQEQTIDSKEVGKDKDRKKLDIPLDVHDKLVEKMIYRLSLAAKDKEIARKMRDEDGFDESLRQYAAKINKEAEKKMQEMRQRNKEMEEENQRLKRIIEEFENRNKN